MSKAAEDTIRSKLHPLLIVYPKEVRDKKRYKDKLLRENPEKLRADYSVIEQGTTDANNPKTEQKAHKDQSPGENPERKKRITNLIFYTNHRDAWHEVLCAHYTEHTIQNIEHGRQIVINGNGSDCEYLQHWNNHVPG